MFRCLFTLAFLVSAPGISFGQVAVTTNRYDNNRTGANLQEGILNRSNVNSTSFGKLFSKPVSGNIFAQPLYMPAVNIPGKGQHNVVYVCTMNDIVYALDADSNEGSNAQPLWKVTLVNASAGITPIPITDIEKGSNNDGGFVGNIGIESTPVIDPATGTIYLLAATKENGSYYHRVHALDLGTGAEKFGGPTVINASVTGSKGTVSFSAKTQNQRAALALLNGWVYIAWARYNGVAPFHGWVIGYNAADLTKAPMVFNTTPSGAWGGIWQSGRGPVADADGNLYYMSSDGDWDGIANFSQSFLKLSTSQNLALLDYFTPYNDAVLSGKDLDIGSSGPMLIPGTNTLVGGGKTGRVYVLSTTSLGHLEVNNTQIVQTFTIGNHKIEGGPVYGMLPDHGQVIYFWLSSDVPKALHFSGRTFNPTPVTEGTLVAAPGEPDAILSFSSLGTTPGSAILWASASTRNAGSGIVPGVLHAFNAGNLHQQLWNSEQNSARDNYGNFAKFVPPVVANGKVYMATFSGQLCVYGLLN